MRRPPHPLWEKFPKNPVFFWVASLRRSLCYHSHVSLASIVSTVSIIHLSIHPFCIYPDIKLSWLLHLPSFVSLLNFESSMQKICHKIGKWKSPHYKLRESSQKRAYGAESVKIDEIFFNKSNGSILSENIWQEYWKDVKTLGPQPSTFLIYDYISGDSSAKLWVLFWKAMVMS